MTPACGVCRGSGQRWIVAARWTGGGGLDLAPCPNACPMVTGSDAVAALDAMLEDMLDG